ncbi:MAG TPA: ribose-phosphate diphosphokinase [Candidatus Nanoarchaeia archaeon]|nr:ribose-phosphate diphosphokinase [Candidatus Nanoarchaeia archaeon]
MIVTSCGNSRTIAKKLAKKLSVPYSPLTLTSFPDGDIYLRYNTDVKGKKVIIVQSFQPLSDASLFHIIFAAEAAKNQGAKKVILVSPYLAYMRQDKAFNHGEAVSSRIMAKLLNQCIDKIITIDPHLHRYKSLRDIFTIPAKCLTANHLIAQYIGKHFKNEVIIGPDWESYQWAEHIAKDIHVNVTVLEKTRFSSRKVKVKMMNTIPLRGKNVIIVDDIISTGHTIAEAAKQAQKLGALSITAIGVHGLFVENALDTLKKAGVSNIITTNCIEHKTNKIDVTPLLLEELKKEK